MKTKQTKRKENKMNVEKLTPAQLRKAKEIQKEVLNIVGLTYDDALMTQMRVKALLYYSASLVAHVENIYSALEIAEDGAIEGMKMKSPVVHDESIN